MKMLYVMISALIAVTVVLIVIARCLQKELKNYKNNNSFSKHESKYEDDGK